MLPDNHPFTAPASADKNRVWIQEGSSLTLSFLAASTRSLPLEGGSDPQWIPWTPANIATNFGGHDSHPCRHSRPLQENLCHDDILAGMAWNKDPRRTCALDAPTSAVRYGILLSAPPPFFFSGSLFRSWLRTSSSPILSNKKASKAFRIEIKSDRFFGEPATHRDLQRAKLPLPELSYTS